VQELTHYRPAMPFGSRKNYFRGSFQFSTGTIKKNCSYENLKFNYSGIFQSLKLRILVEKPFQLLLTLYRPAMPFGNRKKKI